MANWFESAFDGDWNSIGKDIGSFFGNVTGQRESFDYQKELNSLTMSREDTAYQRAVADARSAGLSPLAVTSGASANSMSSARIDNTGALSFGTGLIDTISSANLKNAQATAIRKETEWNERHGFRNQDVQTALVGAIDGIVGKIIGILPRSASEVVSDVASSAKDGASSAIGTVKDKVGDVVGTVKDAVSDAVSKANSSESHKSSKSSEFSPIGFALSSKSSWTIGELQKLHNAYGVNLRFPDKKEYVDIARRYGVTSANSWLRTHTYTADGYPFGRPKQLKYRDGGRSW